MTSRLNLREAWLSLAGGLFAFLACNQEVDTSPKPGEQGFDSTAYCAKYPSRDGCCMEEATHVIDFEDAAVETLTPLSGRYKPLGLDFTASGGPYILTEKFNGNQTGNAAVSGKNALLIGFNHQPVQIVFKNPDGGGKGVTKHVSATVGDKSPETDLIIMKAYGFTGKLVGVDSFTTQPSGKVGDKDFGTVSIEDTSGIYYVVFSDTNTSGANLDDFTYGCVKYKF